jgi:SAM-dependent methyltransferase
MARLDETSDFNFYSAPRYVTHIDDGAIAALKQYYDETLLAGSDVLDLCSSWISHLPPEKKLGRVIGLGMNARELEANEQLTEWVLRDLNSEPTLPFDDESFDAVLNVVSVDYLNNPEQVFSEMHRVLRPGGAAILSFSNRCFPTKAVKIWLDADDEERKRIVASYFWYAPLGGWADIMAIDLKPSKGAGLGSGPLPSSILGLFSSLLPSGDPMFIVRANKRGTRAP